MNNMRVYLLTSIMLICLVSSVNVATSCRKICGDVNCDGTVDMDDAYLLANYVSFPYSTEYEICSNWAAEVSGNGEINIADAMLIANYVSYPDNPGYALRCSVGHKGK